MTRLAENAHVEIEQIARSFESLFLKRAAACVQAVHETAGLIQGHLQTWRDTLCQQMERQLADLAVGCPPSFVRVAGQSHLEKPFNRLLAWLVDPLSDHGCGAAFLKLLALRVEFPELVEDLDLMATDSNWQIEIRAEQELDDDDSGKEPDLAIRTPRAALLLENKVGSPESGDQYAPYLVAFRRWAEPKRKTHAYLCARSERDVPKGWTGFLLHADLAEILYEVSRDKKGVSVWGRISAVMCATALVEASDHEKIRAARQILAETKITSVNTDQITRLREILPLPRPMTPWKELCDE